MMNKKIVPVLAILAVVGAGLYYLNSKKSPTDMVGTQSETKNLSEATEFAKAIESGRPTTCTMVKADDSMVYNLKGKMMATDITAKVEDKTTLSHMINDGSYIYIWSDESKQGSKMAIPTEAETEAMAEQAKQYQSQAAPKFEGEADYQGFKDQGYSINCVAGNFNDSIFTPPAGITFIDPTEVMKQFTAPESTGVDMEKIKELQKQYGGQ